MTPHRLTAVQVRQIKKPGRHADGGGLYLMVDPSGARRWVLRIVVQGRRRDIGLGSARLVTLAEARETATLYRRTARSGADPVAEHRMSRSEALTFAAAARQVHAHYTPSWRNRKHAAQWLSTLETYAFPVFGAVAVDRVQSSDLLRALTPIWLQKPETARRVLQRVRTVFDWAKSAGHRTGDNPAEGVLRALPRQTDRNKHYAALPYEDIPRFVANLTGADAGVGMIPRLAFEFLILTAGRTNEVLGAEWCEIDTKNAVWTIPAHRMKARREHRVPLSPRAVEVLAEARKLAAEGQLIFPGRSAKRPLSNMVFLQALRRMGLDVTAHGFRSSFRDWAAEQTNFPREVCETALAHIIKNKAEAAYRRSDLLDKRRILMSDWADFIATERARLRRGVHETPQAANTA